MTTLVVDASAAGAVLLAEPDGDWVRSQTAGFTLIAPTLLPFELGNICWKKVRRQPEQADAVLFIWQSWVRSHTLSFHPTNLVETMSMAREHNLTFYDATYLWLAQDRSVTLISLDGSLIRAARRIGVPAPCPQD